MHVVITYLVTAVLTLVTILTIGREMMVSFDDITSSWTTVQERSQDESDTKITGPIGLTVSATSTSVQITLANKGKTALGEFADWDVIFEIQKSPGLGISYLAYTENASPGADQWTVKGIYLDASALTDEIVDLGVLNPGEEMIVLANPSTPLVANTYDRATFVVPDGVNAKVIFEVVP